MAYESPLRSKVRSLSTHLTRVGFGSAAVLFVLRIASDPDGFTLGGVHSGIIGAALGALTLVVVAIPDGIPTVMTVACKNTMPLLQAAHLLVRRSEVVEMFGDVTDLCVDKTGVLTKNYLVAEKGVFGGVFFNELPSASALGDVFRTALVHVIALVNDKANLEQKDDGKLVRVGPVTEAAMLEVLSGWGIDYNNVRDECETLKQFKFSPERRRMSCLVRTESGRARLVVLGGEEAVVRICTSILKLDGSTEPLTEETKQDVRCRSQDMMAHGRRVLALGIRDFSEDTDVDSLTETEVTAETEITLVAVIGFTDPLCPNVLKAIKHCHRGGIAVRMITGDSMETAKAIARECGILDADTEAHDDVCVTGKSAVTDLSDAELTRQLVFARAAPKDKTDIVTRLQAQGRVVMYVGDGVNDAPALSAADVSCAVVPTGSTIAKEVSSVLALVHDFAFISDVLCYGREFVSTVRRFLQFSLTMNAVVIMFSLIAVAHPDIQEPPFTLVLMIWVNLFMNSLASIALGPASPRDHKHIASGSFGRRAPLVTPGMWTSILMQGAFQLTVMCYLYFFGAEDMGLVTTCAQEHVPLCESACLNADAVAAEGTGESGADAMAACFIAFQGKQQVILRTFVFNFFMWASLFYELTCRCQETHWNPFIVLPRHRRFLAVAAGSAVLQVLIVQYGAALTGTYPLTMSQWKTCLALSAVSLPIEFLSRILVPRDATPEEKVKSD
eukprot:Rmarinus@m.173